MTRKKGGDIMGKGYVDEVGGGRESGVFDDGASPDGNTARSRGSGDRERLSGSVVGDAAANPAAYCEVYMQGCNTHRRWIGECLGEKEESIRALKARAKELSAMLYEMRSQRDYAIAIQEDRER